MRVSEWLKTYRSARVPKISQDKLAEEITKLGHQITGAQISNYEREYDRDSEGNPTRPPERFMELAAQVLGRPVEEARSVAGYAAKSPDNETAGLMRAIEELPPDRRNFAIRQIRAIIKTYKDDPNFDFNYNEE